MYLSDNQAIMFIKFFLCIVTLLAAVESKPILVQLEEPKSILYYNESIRLNINYSSLNIVDHHFIRDAKYHGIVNDVFNFLHKVKNYREKLSSGLCLQCTAGVLLMRTYISLGGTEDDIQMLTRDVCSALQIETGQVCSGLSALFKREMFMVLIKAKFTASEFCGMVFGSSCGSELTQWIVPLPDIPKPPVKSIPPPVAGSPVTRVLHLSDVHLDPYYMEGSLANCKEPLCCRKSSGNAANSSGDAAGFWGDYRNCDIPLRTVESVLDHINKTQKFDYVIWTGDITPHDIWSNSREEVLHLIKQVTNLVDKYLGRVPIFPALGNHESCPVNSFPVPQIQGNDSVSWLYNPLYEMWGKWVTPKNVETMRLGAYYSIVVNPGFKIVSLNTNYCNSLNWWLLVNSTDPANELHWLVEQLQMSEFKKEKVHIIGHIPPGNSDCITTWSKNYYNIIKRYESTITGQFFGHTHSDEFAVFYDTDDPKEKRPFGVMYIGPSVTTFMGYNPGYRIYTIDGDYPNSSRVVLDHENYIMNLTEANVGEPQSKPKWFLEYTARKAYNMSSLLPYDWDELVQKFIQDDSLFQLYYRYYVKQSDHFPNLCDRNCTIAHICSFLRGPDGPIC